ncbi:FtsX-like permease family protein [Kineococcus sp. TBRC 1896]|uniref:FtsX-like permease family protein n=1 Tax=Kineococcus mangrovi TaxID=1660183 RepID=A0ABV4I5P6_9ACTN
MVGTALVAGLAAALLTGTGSWLQAGAAPGLDDLATVAGSFAGTLVVIAALVVAGVFGGAVSRRRTDLALLRAVGATARQLRRSLTAEAVLVVLTSAVPGAVAGLGLAVLAVPLVVAGGLAPAGWEPPLSPLPVLGALVLLLPTGIVAGRLATRRVLRLSPVEALRSDVQDATRPVSRGRLIAAGVVAVAGLGAAGTPAVVPGVAGAAAGAGCTILLITAAALAGPAVVHALAAQAVRARGARGAASALALLNARGAAARLSAAVIPLALLLGLGVVQSGANATLAAAARQQLTAAVRGDLVATPTGSGAAAPDRLAAVAGVMAATPGAAVAVSVNVSAPDPDLPAADGLDWERAAATALPSGAALLDPGVLTGSLADLREPGTVAVSRDLLAFSGTGVGDRIRVRFAGDREEERRVIAVYSRGLGVGDLLLGDAPGARTTAVLLQTADGRADDVRRTAADLGYEVVGTAEHVRSATAPADAEQRLSVVLLLALLALVAVAAAVGLVTATAARRREFLLLARIGSTRGQLLRTAAIEAVFVAGAAIVVGTAAVLPGLVSAAQGLLGEPVPRFDLPLTGGLLAVVVLLTAATVLPAAWWATRPDER